MTPNLDVFNDLRDALVDSIPGYERRRRRVRLAGVTAALALVVAGLVLSTQTLRRETLGSVAAPGAGQTAVSDAGAELDDLRQADAIPGDGALPTSSVWTGTSLIFAGRVGDSGPIVALSLDPTDGSWRSLPLPPVEIGQQPALAWTGREVVVCCGGGPDSAATAAFNPAAGTWRRLPDAPVHGYTAAIWTGTRLFVVTAKGAALYDPASERWEPAATPPSGEDMNELVWTGSQAILWPRPPTRTTRTGSVYDPASKTWTSLPAPPAEAWPAVASIAWTGKELVVIGGLPGGTANAPEALVGATYSFTTRTWTALPRPLPEPAPCECNLGSQRLVWTGRTLLVQAGALGSAVSGEGVLLSFDPESNSWTDMHSALAPLTLAGDHAVLRTGGAREVQISRTGAS